MSEERSRWISHIKQLRQERSVGLFEAAAVDNDAGAATALEIGRHHVAEHAGAHVAAPLAQPEWRRWVERQINSDIRCRKVARSHMQIYGPASLIYQDGDALKIR